jgi:hypothetical protein
MPEASGGGYTSLWCIHELAAACESDDDDTALKSRDSRLFYKSFSPCSPFDGKAQPPVASALHNTRRICKKKSIHDGIIQAMHPCNVLQLF